MGRRDHSHEELTDDSADGTSRSPDDEHVRHVPVLFAIPTPGATVRMAVLPQRHETFFKTVTFSTCASDQHLYTSIVRPTR